MKKPKTVEIPKRIDYDAPASTDEARVKLGIQRAHEHEAMSGLRKAAKALIRDLHRQRGEDLGCPHMKALDAALAAELDIDKKVILRMYGDIPGAASFMMALLDVADKNP